mmetsp:Transcript_44835/g.116096  ORF Transcript_44835/g.116096 Transcript_44835/m.116096 type:complete len:223 (+) Transcript_44835:516-1184(+)
MAIDVIHLALGVSRATQLPARGGIDVGLAARHLHGLAHPAVERRKRSVLLPQLLVLLKLLTNSSHMGPTAVPEAALVLAHDLGDALVPSVVQGHLLASELHLHLVAAVVARKANMHRLMQIAKEVDEHLHRIRVRELDVLVDLGIIDLRVVNFPALISKHLAVEVLNSLQEADVVLAPPRLRRRVSAAPRVLVHLEVESRHAWVGVVGLVGPTGDIRGVLAA